jgi:twinkle protein
MEKFIRHAPCENCGSRDNLAIYQNHTYCFGCYDYKKTSGELPDLPKKEITNMINGINEALPKRKIDSETCRTFHYETGTYKGQPVHIANYFDKNYSKVAQHLRFPDKSFIWLGDTSSITLFGQNLWRDGGKTVIITEGELDCLSVSKVQNNRYPVVSVPSGASSAKKYIKRELEWLSKFENIILMFDNDEAGLKASIECANILPVKKVKIAKLQGKDANELLVNNKGSKIIDAIFEAKSFTPQGIIQGSDTKDLLLKDDYIESIPYEWNGLNEKLGGIRPSELVLLCAGSGTGKSQVCRELAYNLIINKNKVGYIALEESVKRSLRGLVSIGLNKLIHIPENKKEISEQILVQEWEKIKDYVCFYDHFGSSDSDDLMNRIRYMVQALDCKVIFLDHISIVISGLAEGDERRLLDNTMTSLRKLVEELRCTLFVVSHLKRPEGKTGHEEGLQTSLSHLRGSHSLAQLSDAVIGFERNQQDEINPNVMTARVLKNRFSGDTGVACTLIYNKDTGRLLEGTFDE